MAGIAATATSMLDILPSTRIMEATLDIYHKPLDTLHATRRCGHCHARFTLWHTVGRLPCRGHPGRFDVWANTWSCCGQGRCERRGQIDGCADVDHLDGATYHAAHQHSRDTLTCLPLPVFLLMPDKAARHVQAVYHRDKLPERYCETVEALQTDLWGSDDEDSEEWLGEHGGATFVPPALRGVLACGPAACGDAEREPYPDDVFLWHDTLVLDEFYVFIKHVC